MRTGAKIFLFLAFLSPLPALSQDWQCVREDVTVAFVDTITKFNYSYEENTMWVVSIDSVGVYQGWEYYYNFPTVRFISKTNNNSNMFYYCFDANGPSRMGSAFSALGGENFFFNSTDAGIRISTLRPPNQPWICCGLSDTSFLFAAVSSVTVETILGVSDSVKHISFQAKSNSGKLLTHPMNNKVFKLSKNFGMLTMYDFHTFPENTEIPVHLLVGIKSKEVVSGELNLSLRDVYKFEPGDIFHTKKGGGGPNTSSPLTETILKVLDSKWNAAHDTITYIFRRFYHYYNNQLDGKHIYVKDTISISYSVYADDCTGFDNFSEQTIFCKDSKGLLTSVNSFMQSKNSDYNWRWIKLRKKNYRPGSYCSDTLVGYDEFYGQPIFNETYFIDGCGGPYYYNQSTDWYHKTSNSYFSLVYFKKGSDIWGKPLDTTKWALPFSVPEIEQVKFKISPNPSNGLMTIEIPDIDFGNCLLEINTIMGVKVKTMKLSGNRFSMDLRNYQKGMYIIQIYRGNLRLGEQKLIIH